MDLTQAVSLLLSLVPERHRHTVSVVLLWLGLAQLVVSQIVAQLPVASARHPRWGWLVRGLHAFGHARLRDEPGTVKLPGQGLSIDNAQPPTGQRGSARPGVLLLVAAIAVGIPMGLVLLGCPRLPPVSGCTPMTQRCGPSGWPEVCSASQRWEPAGDVSCTAAGGVCVVSEGVAHCAPGGAP